MASVEQDPISKRYHIRFRFAGREFRRSLKTTSEKLAFAAKARVEETLALIASGRLSVPDQSDPASYILSDGRVSQTERRKLITLQELTSAYQSARIAGVKEPNTEATEDLHLRHLNRLLKPRTFVHTLTATHLQSYVGARLNEKRRGGRFVAVATVRKEVATLRVVWNWARRQELIATNPPVSGLLYPKPAEKPPFKTWAQIEATLRRGNLSKQEEATLWESLYLTREEVQAVLDHVQSHGRCPAIYPLTMFIAHTGVRLSEAVRSQVQDIDLTTVQVIVREKKRSRAKSLTHRRVHLTPPLRRVLEDWLANHPGGMTTFCKPPNLRLPDSKAPQVPFTKHMAREHLKLALKGSRWAKLRGFHVFRHSFASNLASQGVDQRIIDAWLGHQTEEMRQRYRHLAPETMESAILLLLPNMATNRSAMGAADTRDHAGH